MVASFFQDRVETVTAKGGATVFIQRPKERAEGFTASAEDLPDDFDISNISANSSKLYRVSVGPLDVSLIAQKIRELRCSDDSCFFEDRDQL